MSKKHLIRGLYKDKANAIIELYNTISVCNPVEYVRDIPKEALSLLLTMSYDELRAPFIRRQLLLGDSIRKIARINNVDRNHVFHNRIFIGLSKRRNSRKCLQSQTGNNQ